VRSMEKFISNLVKHFESGQVSRREFCETVALAATVYAAAGPAQAQTTSGFKTIGVNHLSYTCPDYAKARDFYTSVFGLRSTAGKDNGKRANLEFGPEAGKGGSFIVARTGTLSESRKASQATIDHICFTMSNWKEAEVRAALAAKNLKISGGRDGSLHVLDPFNYDVQFANLAEEDPFKHGTSN
jgi:catechol 2,3-dioxygenase-like lactoylglutathione lyase family enzyme